MKTARILTYWLSLLVTLSLVSGCGYNDLQAQDEAIKAAWAEVLNQYQRRSDLVPNLVNTVKGYAAHEEKVLTEVAEARSSLGKLQVTSDTLTDPAQFEAFSRAQSQMSSALSRLMVVSENYPQLKADRAFQDLAAQLEGTENRITVARKRYIDAVQVYNLTVRQFPTNLTAKIFSMDVKPSFTVSNEAEISTAPKVDFSKP
ncbi:MAG TPA: LemA family protein [Dongiaceae bacterium]|nr:LemA family protein [Dongiaceae bacterium]